MLHLLFWPLFASLLAAGQGLLMPAIRRTPPSPEAGRQAFALHWLFTIAYVLPYFLCPASVPVWKWLLVGFMARLVLFDLVLNYFAGDPVLAVGQTAWTDRAMRKVSQHPEQLSGLVKALALAATLFLLFTY
jgi:hypothetical protein